METRKRPGPRAKAKGSKLREGEAVKVMVYPRLATKAALVKAANLQNRPLSNFIVISGIERAARVLKVPVRELIPADEYRRLYNTIAS